MRIVGVVFLAALFGAMPAVAQTTCRITNKADGQKSSVSGEVTGTSVSMLVTENGPFEARLTLDADTAYKAEARSGSLNVFRVGNSLEGKNWLEPGSVETVDGGLLLIWPAFSLRGATIKNLSVELSSGWTKKRQTITHSATHFGPSAVFLRLDARLGTPPGSELIETNYSELGQWRSAVQSGAPFKLDIFDEQAGVHIAAIDFKLPASELIQARLISDVTALRGAVKGKTCK
jgi:hypothetical protein